MLFRANPYLWSFDDLTLNSLLELADILAHSSPEARPIFECVKVFVRLDEQGGLRYTRHKNDFFGVEKEEIVSRIKDPHVASAVNEALSNIETTIPGIWPFRPGSTTWCLLEILDPRIRIAGSKNSQSVIVREAVRIDIKGNKTSSSLIERMFSRLKEDLAHIDDGIYIVDPVVYLRNTSGSGAYATLRSDITGIAALEGGLDLSVGDLSVSTHQYLQEAIKRFSDKLFLANSRTILSESGLHSQEFLLNKFPGINVKIGEMKFRLVGSFMDRKEEILLERKKAKKQSLPPLFGWRL